TRTARLYLWANVSDERGWALVHGASAPGPMSLEVGFGGTDALIASRTKALETAVAGFTAKGEAAVPWDGEKAAYAARSEKLAKLLFVGEVVVTAAKAGEAIRRMRALGESKGVR